MARLKEYECKPSAPNLWAPGGLHDTDEHNDVTEWMVFKLDPDADPESGDIVPALHFEGSTDPSGDGPFSWWQAKHICDAHNRDVALALAASPKVSQEGDK